MNEVSFTVSKPEQKIIHQIAKRAARHFHGIIDADVMHFEMDVTATHVNGNPLRLKELAEADDFNFSHDIGGIYRFLDRETGTLGGHFSPRFSQRV